MLCKGRLAFISWIYNLVLALNLSFSPILLSITNDKRSEELAFICHYQQHTSIQSQNHLLSREECTSVFRFVTKTIIASFQIEIWNMELIQINNTASIILCMASLLRLIPYFKLLLLGRFGMNGKANRTILPVISSVDFHVALISVIFLVFQDLNIGCSECD